MAGIWSKLKTNPLTTLTAWSGLSFTKKIIVSYLITISLTIFAALVAAVYLSQLIKDVKEMDISSERSVLVTEIGSNDSRQGCKAFRLHYIQRGAVRSGISYISQSAETIS
ncbi:hypothetical protein ABES25_09700 [Bacillus gobiensis]|uniref:hypothetical protein n=1 Tax=Bacillus gobiensis TaxID=1441095 RepID=UPI003D255047